MSPTKPSPKRPARAPAKLPAKPRRRAVSANVLTTTDPAVVALSADALSIRQRNAARLLAIGYSQQQAADAVAVDVRTIRRWLDEAPFADMVEALHITAWARVEHAIMATLEHAIEVQQQMLRGELAANDKRYLEAARLVDRLLSKLFAVAAPAPGVSADPDGPAAAGSGTAVAVAR